MHVAKDKDRSFYDPDYICIPLIITLSVTDKLTYANVYDQLCNLLEHCVKQPTEEDMDQDVNENDKPFCITYKKHEDFSYTMELDRDLMSSDEIFDIHCHCKIKFTVHWKNERHLKTKMYLECEKDKSYL